MALAYDGWLTVAFFQAEMDEQSTESIDRQRPFKIFISLLDKWEIGHSLTEVLVLDAFAALQTSLRPDDHDELLMTANMLFEILDPFLMWKQIYHSIRASVQDTEAKDVSRMKAYCDKSTTRLV